jgi:hypothetical protein
VWAGYVFFGLLSVLLLIVAALVFWAIPRRAKSGYTVLTRNHAVPVVARPLVADIANARAWAAVTDWIPAILGVLTGLAVIGVVVLVGPAEFGVLHGGGPQVVAAAGLLAAGALVLIGIAIAGFRNRATRRTIGILWDVMTFWPRANHPFTPPCYGQWAVPQLAQQIQLIQAQSPSSTVVLAAHSQGSVIAAAAMLQLTPADAQRVSMLTFGSPLRRIYARYFPAYFGKKAMVATEHRVPHRWINLWALTDPIGGWIFQFTNSDIGSAAADGLVDALICDVEQLTPDGRGNEPTICGHSGFWDRAEFDSAVTRLRTEVTGTAPEA